MPAHHRDGGAQLVPDVVEEPSLPLDRALHPVQHPVHRLRQRRQVVPATHWDPGGEVVLVDLVGGEPELPDRPQQHADSQPGRGDQHHHRQHRSPRVEHHGPAQLAPGLPKVDHPHQRTALVAEHHDDDQDLVAALRGPHRPDHAPLPRQVRLDGVEEFGILLGPQLHLVR